MVVGVVKPVRSMVLSPVGSPAMHPLTLARVFTAVTASARVHMPATLPALASFTTIVAARALMSRQKATAATRGNTLPIRRARLLDDTAVIVDMMIPDSLFIP